MQQSTAESGDRWVYSEWANTVTRLNELRVKDRLTLKYNSMKVNLDQSYKAFGRS